MKRAINLWLVIMLSAFAAAAPAATPTIESADFTNCLLRQDGSVSCWGYGENWQTSPPAGPFEQISLGAWSGCGLRVSGQVECWGESTYGLLEVPAGSYTQIDAGDLLHCALRNDQKIVCWGNVLGGIYIPFPDVSDQFIQVSTGYRNVCGIRSNGSVACGGLFAPIPPTGEFRQISADKGKNDSLCGVKTDGQALCWGPAIDQYKLDITPAGQFSTVGSGAHHACGLRTDGTIACWGYFGNQDYRQYFPPDGQYSSLSVGNVHNCALRIDGVTVCWGMDGFGEAPRVAIDPPAILAAEVGVPYSTSLSMLDKGNYYTTTPYQPVEPLFTTSSGQLPLGVSLSADGQLQGTASAPGQWPVTLLAQDANGYEVERELAFTVVNPGEDVTPPQITSQITGLNLQLDWYSSDVTLSWTVSDPESGATAQVGCDQLVITQDTLRRGSSYTCIARSTGGVTSETVELRRDATPPTVHLSAQTLPEDGFFNVAYSATDVTSDIAYLECDLDGAGFTFCQPGSFTIGQLAPGPHTYSVRARDNAGNTTTRSVPLGPVDTTPPVITPNVSGPAGSNGWYAGDVTLSWTVSDPESSIDSSTGCGVVVVASDTAGTIFTCEATSAGGTSQQSITIKRDTTPPDTDILTGPPDPSDFGVPASFTFEGSDGLAGIAGFECSLDGASPTACASPYEPAPIAPGAHTLSVVASDQAGNTDPTPATYSWTVNSSGDTTPPDVTAVVTGTIGTSGWYRSTVSLSWVWSDDESAIISTTGCGAATVSDDTTGITFTCRVASGGGTTEQSVTIRRDVTPPDTSIRGGKQGLLVFLGSDATSGIAGFACSIDNSPFVDCSSPYMRPVLAGGQHTLAVRTIDQAGNVDPSPDTYLWTAPPIDLTPPTAAPVPSIPANQFGWNNTDVTVNWNWTDTGSGIDGSLCTNRTTSQGEGEQALSATCMDKAGNKHTAIYTARVDKTKPIISPFISLSQILLNATITAQANARDYLSGIDTQGCDPVATSAVGKFTITCAATDRAGNQVQGKIGYTVVYGLAGYNMPIMAPPTVNLLRAGVIIPLRWRLVDANGAPVTNLKGAQVGLLNEGASASFCTAAPQNVITETTTMKPLVHLGDGNYELSWPTPRTWPSECRFLSFLPPIQKVTILIQAAP